MEIQIAVRAIEAIERRVGEVEEFGRIRIVTNSLQMADSFTPHNSIITMMGRIGE